MLDSDALAPRSRRTLLYGQLLSAQLVAMALRRQCGMPLYTCAQAREDPSLDANLTQWQQLGYNICCAPKEKWKSVGCGALNLTHADEAMSEILEMSTLAAVQPGDELCSPGPRVVRPRTTPYSRTLAERQAQYEEVKAAIDEDVALEARLSRQPEATGVIGVSSASEEEGGETVPNNTSPSTGTQTDTSLKPADDQLEVPTPDDGKLVSNFAPITAADQRRDPALLTIIHLLSQTQTTTSSEAKRISKAQKNFMLDSNGLLWQRTVNFGSTGIIGERKRVVVPQAFRQELLASYHELPLYGHRSGGHLYGVVNRHYYWPGCYSDCLDFVAHCEVCQVRGPFKPTFKAPHRTRPLRGEVVLNMKGNIT